MAKRSQMKARSLYFTNIAALAISILTALLPQAVIANSAIGPRGGFDFDTDNIVVGVEGEFGRVLQSFRFAPSLDLELADNTITAFNGDFRLYLFHLPETGMQLYGSVGPTLLLHSSDKKDSQTEIGLSLVGGMKIPMKGQRCYNLEIRFGFGDIPDVKLMLAILFGI